MGLQMEPQTSARLQRLATIAETTAPSVKPKGSASSRPPSKQSSTARLPPSKQDFIRALPARPVRQSSAGPAPERMQQIEETQRTGRPAEQAGDPNLPLKICCGPWVVLAGLCDQAAGVCGQALLRQMPTPPTQTKLDTGENFVVRGKGNYVETAWPAAYKPRNSDSWNNTSEGSSLASPNLTASSVATYGAQPLEGAALPSGDACATLEVDALTPEVQSEFDSLKQELRSLRVNFEHLRREHSDLQSGFLTSQLGTTLPVDMLSASKGGNTASDNIYPSAQEPALSWSAHEPLAFA